MRTSRGEQKARLHLIGVLIALAGPILPVNQILDLRQPGAAEALAVPVTPNATTPPVPSGLPERGQNVTRQSRLRLR